jgi:hypothetical protein
MKIGDRKELEIFSVIFHAIVCIVILQYLTGCMQLTGAKKITMGTWSIDANNGFEAKAGIQQYDRVNDYRGIGSKEGN